MNGTIDCELMLEPEVPPPPPRRLLLAAFTIQSVASAVMSHFNNEILLKRDGANGKCGRSVGTDPHCLYN